jgi:hypothetical protein
MSDEYEINPIESEVKSPLHYMFMNDLEVIDIIHRAVTLANLPPKESYDLGTTLKYLLRLNRKGDKKIDANKALIYMGWLCEDI